MVSVDSHPFFRCDISVCEALNPSFLRIGRDNDFDVVLIDTAGRMQDNEVR